MTLHNIIMLPPQNETDAWEEWKNANDRVAWVGGGLTARFPTGEWAGGEGNAEGLGKGKERG